MKDWLFDFLMATAIFAFGIYGGATTLWLIYAFIRWTDFNLPPVVVLRVALVIGTFLGLAFACRDKRYDR